MHRLGIRIPVGDTLKHIHMNFACFISGEKAEKEGLGVKGAAGTKGSQAPTAKETGEENYQHWYRC